MKTLEVGAFEAKTHLSRLLDEVEKGAVVRITRRGKLVAVLQPAESIPTASALAALERLRELCAAKVPISAVLELCDGGRER